MWMLTVDNEAGIECYIPYNSGISMAGVFNYGALAVVTLFLLCALSLFAESGSSDFRSGNYLIFTWLLESRYRWRLGVRGLISATVAMILGAFVLSTGLVPGLQLNLNPGQLLKLAWTDMLMLIFSSFSMMNSCPPVFDWLDNEVADTTYNRNFIDLVQQTNDSFGQQLANAILRARLGNNKDLAQIAPGLNADDQDLSSELYNSEVSDRSSLLDPAERREYVQMMESKLSAIREESGAPGKRLPDSAAEPYKELRYASFP